MTELRCYSGTIAAESVREKVKLKAAHISMLAATSVFLGLPVSAQMLPETKEGAMMAGSYMGVMNLCLEDVDLTLTTEAKSFAETAQNSQPEAFERSYDAEGHGMTFYDEEGCLSTWRERLGPDGSTSKKIGFTIMERREN